MVKFYQVGGCVRDEILNRKCKDIDYAVEAESFDAMVREVKRRGGKVYLSNPEFFTIRAKVPSMGGDCDFVLCRKDGQYSDGRRPDSVMMGSIDDDLARRDFRMNAIAKQEDGVYYDPFNGLLDIERRVIACVGSADERFKEDSLRMLRALRFSVTLNFAIGGCIDDVLRERSLVEGLASVSVERVREELLKMFKANTYLSLLLLERYPYVRDNVFARCSGLWLMPTLKH